jgi:hypothetical protein
MTAGKRDKNDVTKHAMQEGGRGIAGFDMKAGYE